MSAVKSDAELKGLRTRRDAVVIEVSHALSALREAQAKHNELKGKLDGLNEQIRNLEAAHCAAGITVTEHAYLRYVERVMGIDLAEIRKRMLPQRIESTIQAMGTCKIKTEDGHTLVVRNKTVVSVVDE